jgi:hypothetical protein
MPEGGVDVIVVTATDPSAMAMSAARIWHKSHDQLEFKQAVSREFVLRVPEPRVKRPGALMTALIQTDATDVQEIEQRQAISYAVPEALVVASAAQGREPVLIILDTVHPRWEVDALLPRSLILPNAVDRALLVKMLDDPWASQQELIDWLCEAAPEQFKAAAAAKKYLQRFSPAAAHAFAVCRSAWRGKESAPDLVQASWQVELEDAAGRGEDLSEPVLPYPDGGDV